MAGPVAVSDFTARSPTNLRTEVSAVQHGTTMKPISRVHIAVTESDAFEQGADVLLLKYARKSYGLDKEAYERILATGARVQLPAVGTSIWCAAADSPGPRAYLFTGVKALGELSYPDLRAFVRISLASLYEQNRDVAHVALTVHGAGFGLDEIEAFASQLGGILDAIETGRFPQGLARISFVERNRNRAERLKAALEKLLPGGVVSLRGRSGDSVGTTVRDAGYRSAEKRRAFVAMPFDPSMEDAFHYAMQGATHRQEMLCERVDSSAFTGDILERIKKQIETATIVIADLTDANANVYLEVGYAWGRGVPTVLVARVGTELKFDVRGHRCLFYAGIRDLENKLDQELPPLLSRLGS